jgi:HAD superfamily hydrolase (TIGR01459 family)
VSERDLPDLSALAARHDVFLVDQFGVLHDGTRPYAGAVEGLARLKDRGGTVVLVSNSGKRAAANADRLVRLGFSPGSFDLFVTSGEVAHARLARGDTAGRRCLMIARDGDRGAVDGLGFEIVEDPAAADLVLIAGSEGDRHPLGHYRALLAGPAGRGVPCLCTNPDKVMLTPAGRRFGAGRIADLYADMGGPVTFIGKPHPEIYRAALAAVGDPRPERVVGIGDSVEHDVAGARSVGARAALVRTGILEGLSDGAIAELERNHGARADYLLPSFAWRTD